MHTKLPSDIPKFEGKVEEDLANHVDLPLMVFFKQHHG
jgi:hypothetical protein